jgi:hypothetical protein
MQLLTNICEQLISTNTLPLDKSKGLPGKFCHVWLITLSPKHDEFIQAAWTINQINKDVAEQILLTSNVLLSVPFK